MDDDRAEVVEVPSTGGSGSAVVEAPSASAGGSGSAGGGHCLICGNAKWTLSRYCKEDAQAMAAMQREIAKSEDPLLKLSNLDTEDKNSLLKDFKRYKKKRR